MTASERLKANDDKFQQNKVQYDIDKQAATFSALSSGNVDKY